MWFNNDQGNSSDFTKQPTVVCGKLVVKYRKAHETMMKRYSHANYIIANI